jgi:hypothetical protein
MEIGTQCHLSKSELPRTEVKFDESYLTDKTSNQIWEFIL